MVRCGKNIATSGNWASVGPVIFLMLLLALSLRGAAQNIPVNDSVYSFKSNTPPGRVISQINLSGIQFIKEPGNRINFKIAGKEYYYLLLKLSAASLLREQYLSIDNTSLDSISIYSIYANRASRLLYQGGECVPFKSNRNYVWHTAEVAITEEPSFYLIVMRAPQENINVRYDILTRDILQQKYQHHDRVVFLYVGIVCLIIAIIAFTFLLFKQAVFAAYLGYIIFVSAWIVSHYGYVFALVYPGLPAINAIIKPVSTLTACLFQMLIINYVFRQQLQARPGLQQLIRWMLYLLPALAGCMLLLFIPDLYPTTKATLIIAWHAGLIFSIVIIVFTPLRFYNSGATAKIFSLAMLVICLMATLQLFANSGYIHNYFMEEHGVTMGSIFENSIIAFGLFYNLLEERKQREKRLLALEQEQTETLKKLITVQDNERKRIAGDLHDNIGPLLAALKINFGRIVNTKEPALLNGVVAKTESIIDDSIAEIRNVAHNLMPKSLSSNGLINTLKEYLERIEQLHDKTIIFTHAIQSIISPDIQMNLYRMVSELVLNAAKHSFASLITVTLVADEKLISLKIYDNGKGFTLEPGNNNTRSLGLQSAESRVLYMKGKYALKTEPGRGTFIEIEIPLQLHEPHINGF